MSIVSLCILLKNNNFDEINLKIIKHLERFNILEDPESAQPTDAPVGVTLDQDGIEVINAKLGEEYEEYEEPSSYYDSANFISKDEYNFLTYEYGYDLQKIITPTRASPTNLESQVTFDLRIL